MTWHVLRGQDLQGGIGSLSGSRRSWRGSIDRAGYGVSVTGGVPSRPGNVAASSSSGSVTVTWTAAAANNHPVINYILTTRPGGKSITVPADRTSATIAGLVNGNAYTVSVVAINSVGSGDEGTTAVTTPTGCATTRFSDVPANHAFCPQIAWMASRGITSGSTMGDGSIEFRPANAVIRSAMAPFLYRTLGSPTFTAPAQPSFADVPSSHTFYKEIEWMRSTGISTGTAQPDGLPLYKPAEDVKRQAMAAFLYRAAGSPAFIAPVTPSFADVATDHPFYRQIEWMRATGISTGTTQATGLPVFKPGDAVKRQAMAAFLNRFAIAFPSS
ncbi:MAG: S-layer homology domain-containing protein [Cryobacterium sp.]|nr:S-layer homology domain-containing protein [Cryobacterium sp.]